MFNFFLDSPHTAGFFLNISFKLYLQRKCSWQSSRHCLTLMVLFPLLWESFTKSPHLSRYIVIMTRKNDGHELIKETRFGFVFFFALNRTFPQLPRVKLFFSASLYILLLCYFTAYIKQDTFLRAFSQMFFRFQVFGWSDVTCAILCTQIKGSYIFFFRNMCAINGSDHRQRQRRSKTWHLYISLRRANHLLSLLETAHLSECRRC